MVQFHAILIQRIHNIYINRHLELRSHLSDHVLSSWWSLQVFQVEGYRTKRFFSHKCFQSSCYNAFRIFFTPKTCLAYKFQSCICVSNQQFVCNIFCENKEIRAIFHKYMRGGYFWFQYETSLRTSRYSQ